MEEYPKPEQHWFDADKNSGSEPSKKRKKKPTDHNNFEPGQELEFDVNNRVIRGKFIRYDLEDKEKVFIETTHDDFHHDLIQRVHLSWLVNKKQPTGILKDLLELKRYEEDYDGIAFEHEDGSYVLWSDVEAIINKYFNP